MAKKSLPKLTEAQVRKLASAQSFERGERYYRDGAIIDPVQQDLVLRFINDVQVTRDVVQSSSR